jgi:hypothetical protein
MFKPELEILPVAVLCVGITLITGMGGGMRGSPLAQWREDHTKTLRLDIHHLVEETFGWLSPPDIQDITQMSRSRRAEDEEYREVLPSVEDFFYRGYKTADGEPRDGWWQAITNASSQRYSRDRPPEELGYDSLADLYDRARWSTLREGELTALDFTVDRALATLINRVGCEPAKTIEGDEFKTVTQYEATHGRGIEIIVERCKAEGNDDALAAGGCRSYIERILVLAKG